MKFIWKKNGLEQQIEFENEDAALLEILEKKGLPLPHGCRSGNCGSCVIKVLEGADKLSDISYLENDTLDRFDDKTSLRLSCRAQCTSSDKETKIVAESVDI